MAVLGQNADIRVEAVEIFLQTRPTRGAAIASDELETLLGDPIDQDEAAQLLELMGANPQPEFIPRLKAALERTPMDSPLRPLVATALSQVEDVWQM